MKKNEKMGKHVKNEVAVVIPNYRSDLSREEEFALHICKSELKDYPIYLLVSKKNWNSSYINQEGIYYLEVPDTWFYSIYSYNSIMMQKEIYELFIQYKYMLICQLDALILNNRLSEFCEYGYDYIGAPWLNGMVATNHMENGVKYVGNGGLSLRKVDTFLEILDKSEKEDLKDWTEDVFWSSQKINIAPVSIALSFAFERQVKKCFRENNYTLPFGVHAWQKYDPEFWYKVIQNRGGELVVQKAKGRDRNGYINMNALYVDTVGIKKWIQSKEVGEVVIFGAGTRGKLCRYVLRSLGAERVRFIDNNEKLWGTMVESLRVFCPQILSELNNYIIIIAVKREKSILQQLKQMGLSRKQIVLYEEFLRQVANEASGKV